MDPMITGIILGTALRQCMIRSKRNKAYRRSVDAAKKIAEAEIEVAQHAHLAEVELDKLFKRITGIINYLEGSFANLFAPFENENNKLKSDLLQGLTGLETVGILAEIRSLRSGIIQKPQIEKFAEGRKISGTTATTAYILFGNLGVANQQLSAATVQQKKAELISSHMDSFCVLLDLQRERFFRINQTLGALNVALITATSKAINGFGKVSWILDEKGRLPEDITAAELKMYLEKDTLDSLAICVNVARCMYAILAEPLFDENTELTQRAQSLLDDGQAVIGKIQTIEGKRGGLAYD